MTLPALRAVLLILFTACLRVMFGLGENSFLIILNWSGYIKPYRQFGNDKFFSPGQTGLYGGNPVNMLSLRYNQNYLVVL
jgi:hypothetical protein